MNGNVEGVEVGKRYLVYEHGPERIEQNLEGCEEGFACDAVEEDGFKGGREIGVQSINAQALVVCEVIWAERGRVRNANGKVCENREEAVEAGGLECEVMGNFVNG